MIKETFSTITKETTQAKIWALMSDINNWNTWDSSVVSSSISGKFETGNRFMLKPKGGFKVNITLSEVKPSSYFRDLTRFPLAKMYGEHWYEETPEGLKITVTMTITGLLAPLWNMIVMKDIVKNLKEDIDLQIRCSKELNLY